MLNKIYITKNLKLVLITIVPFLFFGQEFQSNLPIVVINTNGNTIMDNPRIVSDMGIIHNDSALNNLSDEYNNYDGKISIELRGSSSQDFPKKSYSLETQSSSGDNNNVSLLDLPNENDWILYGAYSDKSLLRNSLTYELSRQMGHYAPKTKYCELFINSEYEGIYILTEKIKRDKNRVDISESQNNNAALGGYIIKIDKLTEAPIDASWCSSFTNFNNDAICFQYHYPKADDITIEQKNYIANFMNEIDLLIRDLPINQTNINLIDKIDFLSFIDYFIISELSKDVDAYRLSVFLHKDGESNNNRLKMGPVWDYNLSFGNVDFCQASNVSGWVLEEETACRASIPSLWGDLIKNKSFRDSLSVRWNDLRNSILNFDNIFHHIDSIGNYLNDAQDRNFERWDILGEWIWPNYQLGPSYQDELSFLKYWIYHRINWIDQNLHTISHVFPDCLSEDKQLIQISDQLGKSIHDINSTDVKGKLLFYLYDNGCVDKKIVTY